MDLKEKASGKKVRESNGLMAKVKDKVNLQLKTKTWTFETDIS
jgi:hypothetical protein